MRIGDPNKDPPTLTLTLALTLNLIGCASGALIGTQPTPATRNPNPNSNAATRSNPNLHAASDLHLDPG